MPTDSYYSLVRDKTLYGLDGHRGSHDKAYRKKVDNTNPYVKISRGGTPWKDHKYIDKVETKNGKIRYVYELPNGRRVSYQYGTKPAMKALQYGGDGKHSNRYRRDRQEALMDTKRYAGYVVSDISRGDVKSASYYIKQAAQQAPKLGKYFTDQVGDVVDNGKNFMRGLGLPF